MNNFYWQRYIKFILWCDARPIFEGYYEKHHIIPKALGGDDTKDNLIRLDAREHYIAHLLLYRAIPCKETQAAFKAMAACSSKKKVLTSHEYNVVRSFKYKSKEDFIKEAQAVHGNKYDYSISEYYGVDEKFKYICPTHGVIEQTYYHHIVKKHGCRFCGYLNKTPARNNYNTELFVEKAKKAWGDLYDFSLVEYTKSKNNVIVVCPEHGEFTIRADKLIMKNKLGCPKCGYKYKKDYFKVKEFIKSD